MTIASNTDSTSVLDAFEGRMSLNALLDDLIEHARDEVCISYIKSAEPFHWHDVTAAQLDQCIRAATAHYAQHIQVRHKHDPCVQIALLAESSFDYFVTEAALLRLGYGVALLSPNNSVPAIIHLLKTTNSTTLVYGPDKAKVAQQVRQDLQNDSEAHVQELVVAELFSVQQLISQDKLPPPSIKKDPYRSDVPYQQQAQEPAVALHSSGSTGFPKPYTLTHHKYMFLIGDRMPYDALCTPPIYHAYAHAMVWRQLIQRRRVYIYSETIRPDLISEAVRQSTTEIIYAVPFTFKMLGENEESLEMLRNVKICCFSGAPCPTEVGDMLVAKGVNLMTFLGATETGAVMDSLRDFETDKGWNVMRPMARVAPHMKFENVGTTKDGPFEMVVTSGWKALSKVNRDDGSYASGDHYRLVRNKDGSVNGYVYLARGDDTLVHFNGEKTNPVPMEQTIRSSPLVRDCLVFGAGQASTGTLIIPYAQAWEAHAQSSEQDRQMALKEQIKPLLQEVNSQCPSHSRLVAEMVRFLPPDSSFPLADKGSIKRGQANQMYSQEITQLYTEFDLGTSTPDKDKISIESKSHLSSLLQGILERFLDLKLDGSMEDKDLTNLGVDSVMDSQIRSQIHRSVRMPGPLPGTIVFQNPTLRRLTDAVFQHIRQENVTIEDQKKQHESRTYQILEELRSKLKARDATLANYSMRGEQEFVVLTGVTGSLGAHILDQLRRKETVAKVVCLNRASDHQDAANRTDKSLTSRGLASVEQGTGAQVVSLAANLSEERLGLTVQEYDDLARNVTCVISNGWPVNFVMSVDSFRDVLEGNVRLMNLAGRSTGCRSPRFLYASSIAVTIASPEAVITEQIHDTLENTLDQGYAQSKWIAEALCRDAEKQIGGGFQSIVLRIGQMVGDRSEGVWNETEAPPLMIKSAQTLGCLPRELDDLYWLPVDVAGQITAQLTLSPLNRACVLVHVVSEQGLSWGTALETLAQPENLGKSFEVVSYADWVAKLEASDQNPSRNPTIKLLGHYRSMQDTIGSGQDAQARLDTTKLRENFAESPLKSQIFESLEAYRPEYLTRTVAAWKRTGFLK